MAHESTPYSVLRVPEEASPEEIRQAYRKLVKLWHPDLHPDDMSAEKRMQEITEAYTVLSDEAKKWKYDESLTRKRAAQRAKEEEQARKAARAAAEKAASSQNYASKKAYSDPDRPPVTNNNEDSYFEDFTQPSSQVSRTSPFVVPDERPVRSSDTSRSLAESKLTSGEKYMEDFSVALCVVFPVLLPIVFKHMKESLEEYPDSRHYQDLMTSLKIVTGFALPLWAFLIVIVVRAIVKM